MLSIKVDKFPPQGGTNDMYHITERQHCVCKFWNNPRGVGASQNLVWSVAPSYTVTIGKAALKAYDRAYHAIILHQPRCNLHTQS